MVPALEQRPCHHEAPEMTAVRPCRVGAAARALHQPCGRGAALEGLDSLSTMMNTHLVYKMTPRSLVADRSVPRNACAMDMCCHEAGAGPPIA